MAVDDWTQIRFTSARQVAELMSRPAEPLPDPEITPAAYYGTLRDAGRGDEAIAFLGQALPRYEAVAWAGHVLEEDAAEAPLPPLDRRALDYALRWIGDPDDANRRAARDAGEAAGARAAERMLASAVFYSGGSMAPPDLPPVQPAPEIAGRFAAGAIRIAVQRHDRRPEATARALAAGERIAAGGLDAIAPR